MHTVLIAMNDEAGEDRRDQVRAQLRKALPQLQLTFAHTLEDALRARPPSIVITFNDPWLPNLVRERSSIEWIHLLSAGADRFLQQDLPFDRLRISTSSGVHAATIGDSVMAGVLYHTKHLARFAAQQREHRWERGPQEELEGRTVAILGLGAIGRGIAARATAFGMRVIGVKRTPGDTTPRDTTPADTKHVDELYGPDDLHEVLATSDVLAVTLDVFADEPLPSDSPPLGPRHRPHHPARRRRHPRLHAQGDPGVRGELRDLATRGATHDGGGRHQRVLTGAHRHIGRAPSPVVSARGARSGQPGAGHADRRGRATVLLAASSRNAPKAFAMRPSR